MSLINLLGFMIAREGSSPQRKVTPPSISVESKEQGYLTSVHLEAKGDDE